MGQKLWGKRTKDHFLDSTTLRGQGKTFSGDVFFLGGLIGGNGGKKMHEESASLGEGKQEIKRGGVHGALDGQREGERGEIVIRMLKKELGKDRFSEEKMNNKSQRKRGRKGEFLSKTGIGITWGGVTGDYG